LQVADLGRSLDFYQPVIGLRVLEREGAWVRLGAHGDDRPLVELHERPGATPAPRRGRLGLFHFAILLPDRSSLGRFLVHLAESAVAAGMSDHLVSEAIYLTDPDGLGIEVYADRPRALWTHSHGELAMTTMPLEVHGVRAAAGGGSWDGMPPGTVIGHVHLHVGDLEQAATFYHVGLGFDKTVWSYPGALFMAAGGYHHHLGTNTWAATASPAAEDDARLLEWTIVVPDEATIDAVAESIAERGASISRSGSGIVTRDPWGTAVRIRCG